MKERIYEYLTGRSATSEEVASGALGLKGAAGTVADRVVEAAVEGDRRFMQGDDGLWSLRPSSGETQLQEAAFVTVGVRVEPAVAAGPDRLLGIAGRRFGMRGAGEGFAEVAVVPEGAPSVQALSAFARFCEGAVPAAFRLPRVRAMANCAARRLLGRPLLGEGVCLFRLARRVYPDRTFPSVEAVAEAAEFSYRTERGPEVEADLQADLLLFLLERHAQEGRDTLEAVVADLYPDALPVNFEAYAFDEAFLDDLPREPGVYVMRDRAGRAIYVGKSVCLQDRVKTYFSRRAERPEKTRRILDRIWSVEVEAVGSELEALLLEARTIRACRPEFNTQVAVRERDGGGRAERHFVLTLPSADPESIELFCVRRGRPLEQIRVRRDLTDWAGVAGQVRRLFYEQAEPEGPLSEADAADLEILKGWMRQQRERVNWVDMEAAGGAKDGLRVLRDTVEGVDLAGWEKVWRV